MGCNVEKLQFSFMISPDSRDLNPSVALVLIFLNIVCLHVSFTAYDNFYKLTKNALSS